MAENEEEIEVSVICWKDDRRFSFTLESVTEPVIHYLGKGFESREPETIRAKTYVVKCPYCGADNEVEI
jgi:hypothetical protein